MLRVCEHHEVAIEQPTKGRTLSASEEAELQRVADASFRDARALLEGLPPRITLIVSFGKDVNPDTGETGSAGYPGNIGLTLDPDRDVGATIRTFARPCILHELHHLARKSRVNDVPGTLDRVISEGLATAFERDVTKATPPWGDTSSPDVELQARELVQHPERADADAWVGRVAGRRWIGHRAGTFLVDRAAKTSNRTAATLVFAKADEVLRLAHFP